MQAWLPDRLLEMIGRQGVHKAELKGPWNFRSKHGAIHTSKQQSDRAGASLVPERQAVRVIMESSHRYRERGVLRRGDRYSRTPRGGWV